jgi:hypothetical protein
LIYSLRKNECRIFKPIEITIRWGEEKGEKYLESRKIEKMDQFVFSYIHTWKCHKETPCIAILNKEKNIIFFFYKITEQVEVGGWYQLEGKGCGEKM